MNVDEKQLRKRLSRPDTEIFLSRNVDYGDLADVVNEYLEQHNTDLVERVEEGGDCYDNHVMGCGLEDLGITDRYEAMKYGYEQCLSDVLKIIKKEK